MKRSIPSLLQPFEGRFPITNPFGAFANIQLKTQDQRFGLVSHNGVDIALPEGTTVITTDSGRVMQSGQNGDFGISITIRHRWGESLYAHLAKTFVTVGDRVKRGEPIAQSGATGLVTGPHLHFGIRPKDPDLSNGYLGFIDPLPYVKND